MVKSALRMNTEAQKERQASQRRAEAEQRGSRATNANSGFSGGRSEAGNDFASGNSGIGGGSSYNAVQSDSGASSGGSSGATDAGSSGTANRATRTAPDEARSPQEERRGVFASARRGAAEYLEGHGHAVVYGVIGFVAAALILIVGFWPTVLLALFAAIGVAVGRYRDGDQKTQVAFRSLIGRMR